MGAATETSLQAIAQALAHLADPEIPVVSLTELGILREVREGADGTPEVVITPTYSGCPAMGQIEDDIVAALREAGLAARVITQLSPAWTTDWMSDVAREKLRTYGIAPPHCTQAAPTGVLRFSRQAVTAEAIACPQCGSHNTTETSPFGSTACKALYRCLDCLEPFDYFKPI
ncbi:1,2-phenylacetyl-CoA epoxidase subunit PaaD [Hydrogenophaga sp.]|uniref:1,2-phenylacetyl-CoA epoxidase subunit PaaD n=1 Tax=Hydrogenophaga sp. TaxID=1904254 RepID=UPI003F6D25B2